VASAEPRGRLKPVNAIGPIAGSIFTLLGWAALAHNSGSGWVQALGVVLFATLLVGILGPGRVVSRSEVEVVTSPSDAIAGDPIEIEVIANTRVRVKPAIPEGKTTFCGPTEKGPTPVVVIPERRGILVAITADVASAAPFGILWWSKRTTIALPVEICVAPKPTTSIWIPPDNDDWTGEAPGRRTASVGEMKGVRDYQHGDARRTVHWRASAHTGRMMVREMEAPTADPIVVRLVLPVDQKEADDLAGYALATILALLDHSRLVMLATTEASGDKLSLVTGPEDAGRRLARAVARRSGGHGVPESGSLTIHDPRSTSEFMDSQMQSP
jgi:uncharacterized protein (DUF58 family)